MAPITPPPPPPPPPPATIPALQLAEGLKAPDFNAADVVSNWLSTLQQQLDSKELNLTRLFIDESWWRDLVAVSWDTRTLQGPGPISKYLAASDHGLGKLSPVKSGALQPTLLDNGGAIWIQSGFTFETRHGTGHGVVHLVNVSKDEWKAWMVLTQIKNLKGEGVATNIPQQSTTTNGTTTTNGVAQPDYQVIIVGAGQSGLSLAAHLHNRGLKYLVIDQVSRIGDSWRARYKSITSHTPKYTDHFAFLPFPSNYPKYLNQDKISSWLEAYAQIMSLNTRLSTTVTSVSPFDPSTKRYTLTLTSPTTSHPTTLTTTHLVLATGLFGLRPIIPTFPSQSLFRGTLYHAKQHTAATSLPDLSTKKVAIIGAGTSAHDIAEDFSLQGAGAVTLIQRSGIFTVSRGATEQFMLAPWNSEVSGLRTEEADLVGQSFPFPVVRSLGAGMTVGMNAMDERELKGLEARGMRVKWAGKGEGALVESQLIQGGHFYIDQGCWREILEGRVGVVQCDGGVVDVNGDGVVLADGRTVEADVVVLATGYERCWTNVRDLLGEEALEVVGPVTHFDKEGEVIGVWRPTGLKGFWYMTGSFIWSRQFSALLALQIDAVERGLNEKYWEE